MTGIRWTEDDLATYRAKRLGPSPVRVVDRDAQDLCSPAASRRRPTGRDAAPGGEGAEHSPRPIKTKRKRPEEDLQVSQVEFLNYALMPPWRFLHIPNQKGTRSTWENKLLKAMGVQDGAADLLLLGPPARFVWIENKSSIGRLSPAQEDWRDWVMSIGGQWFLCRSVDDLIQACGDAGVPLRVRA